MKNGLGNAAEYVYLCILVLRPRDNLHGLTGQPGTTKIGQSTSQTERTVLRCIKLNFGLFPVRSSTPLFAKYKTKNLIC
jgi:hypothetical protein